MALGDKVEELQRAAATLTERLNHAVKSLDALYDAHKDTAHHLAELRREYEREVTQLKREVEKEVALLTREVEDFKKWKDDEKKQGDEWNRRLWAFGPNLLAAVIGGLIAGAIAYFIRRP